MYDAAAMCLFQGVGDLNAEFHDLRYRDRASFQTISESFPVDVLHDEEVTTILSADVVQYAYVRVIQAGDDLRFALKALATNGVGRDIGRENLDGDCTLEADVSRTIHFSHSAHAESCDDLIGA